MQPMDETFDYVVVGSGGGSMCAGLVMRKAGKSVLILEKTEALGGSTSKSGGVMWIPNNRFMAAEGIEDSFEKACTYLDAVVGDHNDTPGATRERRETYVRQAPAMVDFLVEQGINLRRGKYYPDYYDERPAGSVPGRTVVAELFDVNELGPWKAKLRASKFPFPASLEDLWKVPLYKVSREAKNIMFKMVLRGIYAKLTGKEYATAGRALQGRMLQAAIKAGIEMRTHSPVKELILENSRVVGVVTYKDNHEWRVAARLGVLLNAGGFAHNQTMRDKHIPRTKTEWSHAAPGDTGDMHRELMRIGAAMAQMEEMVGNQMAMTPLSGPAGMHPEIAKPHCILVDQSGVRYLNEGGSYMEFCQRMLARDETVPAIPSWMIMDSRFLRNYMLAGSMPGSKKPAIWTDHGFLRTADTIDALAIDCGMDQAKFKATIERFNGFARKGHDEDFNRGGRAYDQFLGDHSRPGAAATLGTIEEGPFYAVPIVPGDVGTFGGAVTDIHARVLREDGSVIPGLYATGTTTASVMGRTYPGAGCSIGPSFTWGYVAAKHAVDNGNQRT
jgi:3-oxosteroid 1-dehydrogenase